MGFAGLSRPDREPPSRPRSVAAPRGAPDFRVRALVGLQVGPGVVLSTSPHAPRTHWDQIYLPLLEPISAEPGDEIALDIESETGGGESGIEVRWTVRHERGGRPLGDQALSIGAGWLG